MPNGGGYTLALRYPGAAGSVRKKGSRRHGSRKHGINGRAEKGPATRLWLDMQAPRDERKPRTSKLRFTSVYEALEKDRNNLPALVIFD